MLSVKGLDFTSFIEGNFPNSPILRIPLVVSKSNLKHPLWVIGSEKFQWAHCLSDMEANPSWCCFLHPFTPAPFQLDAGSFAIALAMGTKNGNEDHIGQTYINLNESQKYPTLIFSRIRN